MVRCAATIAFFAVCVLSAAKVSWAADPLNISLAADGGNPRAPQMGDYLVYHSIIRNAEDHALVRVIAWINMVRVDPGHEEPLDLEDWSAHKAVTVGSLAPAQAVAVEWPIRLIQGGEYRIVISAITRESQHVVTSPSVDFQVRSKPVVESRRILPVAFGVPLLIAVLFGWRTRWALKRL